VASEEDAAARSTAARSLVVSPIDAIDRRAPIARPFSRFRRLRRLRRLREHAPPPNVPPRRHRSKKAADR
jgi:hypothetical protein